MSLWLTILSDQLPVIALVGHYPTNKLIGRRPILRRAVTPVLLQCRTYAVLPRLSAGYPPPKGTFLRVPHPSATLPPCGRIVRLACLRHAASVHPEPGSNSQKISYHILNAKFLFFFQSALKTKNPDQAGIEKSIKMA